MTGLKRALGLAAAMASALGLSWMSQAPIAPDTSDRALLRLAWRARPERIEHCVTQSPDALAALPPHMRQATVCEGINASYRLEVRRNGVLVDEQHVEPGGMRRDRPLYVLRELAMPVGDATISVTFVRVEAAGADDDDDAGEARDTLREAVPASLAWEQPLSFAPRQVRVVSYDPERRELFEVRRE
ncbi:MAG: hypothetical protein IT183_03800 [Acidobacteria bacterium]|nr:hypothetical protein [Acidobacteriota bacterium]